MLNQCEWGSKRLRTHSARVVPLVRRLGRSLGHVIRHHIESGTEGSGDVSEFDASMTGGQSALLNRTFGSRGVLTLAEEKGSSPIERMKS